MASVVDLERACRAAGLPVDTVPDFLTNGHDGVRLLNRPTCGYWHHTAALGLGAVWGLPDQRPAVPQPRCNVWLGLRGGALRLVFVSAGVSYHAGAANLGRIRLARAGGVGPGTLDASVATTAGIRLSLEYLAEVEEAGRRWPLDRALSGCRSAITLDPNPLGVLPDDFGGANSEAVGLEVEWVPGMVWLEPTLNLIARYSAVCVETFGWSGPGHFIHHRQATSRKPDMDYRGDLWLRTRQVLDGVEVVTDTDVERIAKRTAVHVRDTIGLAKASQIVSALTEMKAVQAASDTRILTGVTDAKSMILGAIALIDPDTLALTAGQLEELAQRIAALDPDLTANEIVDTLGLRLHRDAPAVS